MRCIELMGIAPPPCAHDGCPTWPQDVVRARSHGRSHACRRGLTWAACTPRTLHGAMAMGATSGRELPERRCVPTALCRLRASGGPCAVEGQCEIFVLGGPSTWAKGCWHLPSYTAPYHCSCRSKEGSSAHTRCKAPAFRLCKKPPTTTTTTPQVPAHLSPPRAAPRLSRLQLRHLASRLQLRPRAPSPVGRRQPPLSCSTPPLPPTPGAQPLSSRLWALALRAAQPRFTHRRCEGAAPPRRDVGEGPSQNSGSI